MKQVIRRHWTAYLLPILWIYFFLAYAVGSSTGFVRFTLVGVACIGLVSLANSLASKNYFQIKGDELVIHGDFFRTRSMKLKTINRVEIEPAILSTIYLHNGERIRYMNWMAPEASVKELLGQFNIPVE